MVEMNQPFIVICNPPPGITIKYKIEVGLFLMKAS